MVTENPLAPSWLSVPDDANLLPDAVWSMNSSRAADGELEIAGVPVSTIAGRFGTPVYVVDEADAKARARRIREAFDREFARVGSSAKVYYAGKAFLCTEVARWVIAEGNNKSLAEIERAVEIGVGAIILDSLIEIERVAEAAARHGQVQPVRLRINSGVHASTHEYLATAREDQKFGIPLADAGAAVARIREHTTLDFLGLHSHIGSQIFESDGFAEAARRLFALHAELLEGGPVPELNLGGGFGIAYTSVDEPLAIDEVAARFADIVAHGAAELDIPVPVVAIEPGRSVIGPSTTTLYTVGTIKDVLVDATATRKYVSVDGGMSDNIRPSLYRADYSARIVGRVSAAEPALVRVAGKHCESGDILVHAEYLPGDVRPGDLLGIPATGAYGWAMASNYNYLARPPVVAVLDGVARVIVRGETEDDLLRRDAGVPERPAKGTA
jgi:diaminopimelate decarboxylase